MLVALLFIRYAPDLLTFPFNSGHSIKSETVDYAKKINERFPRRPKDINMATGGGYFHLSPHDKKAEQILAFGCNNPEIPGELPQTFLKAVFESSRAYGLFTAYFDAELYYRAVNFYENNIFGRDRLMYAIVGITRVLEDVEISQSNLLLNQNIKHFIEKDFCRIYKNTQTFDKFKPYLTARVDIAFETKSDKVDFQLN